MFRDQFWEFAKFEGGMAAKQLSFEELKDINYETIAIHLDSEENHLLVISFTRSNRMNSFIPKQYQELSFVLYQVANIPSVHAVLLRGEGKFYSSGHDLSYQMKEMSNHQGGVTKELMIEIIEKNASSLVKSLIDFDKPIIAACHGPAFGIAATTLALCDIVYASEVFLSFYNIPRLLFGNYLRLFDYCYQLLYSSFILFFHYYVSFYLFN